MVTKKIRGIYLRGKVYWLTHGTTGKRRVQVSLETSDYVEAVKRAEQILSNPLLNTTQGFKADVDKFADDQTGGGIWTKNSRSSKYSVLVMFGEDLDWTATSKMTTGKIQQCMINRSRGYRWSAPTVI